MKPRKQSMDGFVTKRPQRTSLGEITSRKTTTLGHYHDNEDSLQMSNNATRNIQQPASANKLKQNISESLAAIDENTKPSHRHPFRHFTPQIPTRRSLRSGGKACQASTDANGAQKPIIYALTGELFRQG